jgi:hypothetical protein
MFLPEAGKPCDGGHFPFCASACLIIILSTNVAVTPKSPNDTKTTNIDKIFIPDNQKNSIWVSCGKLKKIMNI